MTGRLFRDRLIPLEEFPSLFTMEAHTGFTGVVFATVWLLSSYAKVPGMWGPPLALCALAVCFSFFGLAWLSTTFSNSARERIIDTRNDAVSREKLEARVRKQIALLSGLYVVVCCFLIFLTGGATSPFSAFYIMIFTLTIGKNTVPYPGFAVLGYYLIGITIACAANYLWPWPITPTDMQKIHESGFHELMHFGFIAASLAVPTFSAYFVKRKEEQRKRNSALTPP